DQMEDAVCSETEADDKISDHAGEADAHHSPYPQLTLGGFRVNPAIGDMLNPERINDTEFGTYAKGWEEALYAQVDLPQPYRITQFRQYGTTSNNGDGRWTIQYLDIEDVWQDWVTSIPTVTINDYGAWDSSGGEVVAKAIKLICTTVDTGVYDSAIFELEVKF
ncbi:unnamed protein product, partial [marine sediment metagenome]